MGSGETGGELDTVEFTTQLQGPLNNFPMNGWWGNGAVLANRHGRTDAMCEYADGHVKFRNILYEYTHGIGDPLCEWCNGN